MSNAQGNAQNKENTMNYTENNAQNNVQNNVQNKEAPIKQCGIEYPQNKKHACTRQAGHSGIHTDGQLIW